MTYLLDVASLVALLWETHPHYLRVKNWSDHSELAVCPITEVGFLRVSEIAYGSNQTEAAKALSSYLNLRKPAFVPCDVRGLDGLQAPTGRKTTDFYLCNLAQAHGMKLATLDEGIGHPAAFLIPKDG